MIAGVAQEMENGFEGTLADKFSGLGIDGPSSNDNLFQVMKAVEAAEATIKQQVSLVVIPTTQFLVEGELIGAQDQLLFCR